MAGRHKDASAGAAIVLDEPQETSLPDVSDRHAITQCAGGDADSVCDLPRARDDSATSGQHVTQQLIEALPVPVFFKARDGRYLGVNRAWERFFGMTRDQILGQKVAHLYPQDPAIAEQHELMDAALWAEPGSQQYEIRLRIRDNVVRDALYCKATYTDAEGRVAGLIGTIIDITARKQGERRHAIEHAMLRALADSDAIENAIPRMIRSFCETLGWACGARWIFDEHHGALRCRESWNIEDGDIAAFVAAVRGITFKPEKAGLIRRVLATGQPVWITEIAQSETFVRGALARKAGLVTAFALPIRVGDRTIGALEFFSKQRFEPDEWMENLGVAVGSQIGEFMARKQAERELRDSEARFRSLTELSSDWYWEQDEFYRFTSFSSGMVESVGISPEAFVGTTRWDAKVIGMTAADWAAHKATLDARQPFQDLEYGRVDADGKIRYLSTSGQPVFDDAGRFIGYRGVGRDITERKTAEAALQAAHADLERKARELARSNAELEQFAYVASHDLQEPLRMISSYTQLLERRYASKLDDDGLEFMRFIVDGAARMKQLIEDLLAYSRVGTRTRPLQQLSMKEVFDRAVSNLRGAIEASGAQITAGSLPEVYGDEVQLAQLLQNLIGNAIKFRGGDVPRIHVDADEIDTEWHFRVRDNGIGIEPAYFERIFMVFQRLHTRDEYDGTGIGLAICRKVVDRHGGRLWVESTPGAGSTFHFTLPRKERTDDAYHNG
ncbi:MAG: ATP-binding protein [Rhodospirillaceae bacterium]